ncbi:MAG: hypothetical protein JO166_24320 [Deltaproteobacteria bacterium]|nr:hypothetical protein [Deltaproteobacteria bacterium]
MMTAEGPHLTIFRHRRNRHNASNSSNKLLKIALWIVWLPIVAVLWVILLDTSYDWISSPSSSRVIAGLLILILMGCVVVGLVVMGARRLWTR